MFTFQLTDLFNDLTDSISFRGFGDEFENIGTKQQKIIIPTPGVKKEDIKVIKEGDILKVNWKSYSGTKQERRFRVRDIPTVKYDNGLLTIHLKPDKAEVQEIKIE